MIVHTNNFVTLHSRTLLKFLRAMRTVSGALRSAPFTIFLLISLIITGCQKTTIQYGEQYVDNGATNIILVDSISPVVSTIYKDSVVTSQSGNLLVGNNTDPYFGKINAAAYVQLGLPTIADLLANAQYDSLVLLTKANGVYSGDTTLPVTLRVNQLTDELKFVEGQSLFYNTTNFPANATPLGSRSFVLRPLSGDSANIRLDDTKGQDLFNMIRTKADIVRDITLFTNYIKGIKISATSNNNVYGFKDSVVMRLYYHQTDLSRQDLYFDFPFSNVPLQYNQITTDRSSTPLAALSTLNNELLSTSANNIGYLQSATGLYLKISFPTIRRLLERSDFIKLLRAQLVVRPVQNSFSGSYPLPPTLYAQETDGANEGGAAITSVVNGAAQTETGNLSIDYVYGSNTAYTYDVTSYLTEQLAISANNKNGLLLLPPINTRYSSLDRLVIGDAQKANSKIQLNVYYISVK